MMVVSAAWPLPSVADADEDLKADASPISQSVERTFAERVTGHAHAGMHSSISRIAPGGGLVQMFFSTKSGSYIVRMWRARVFTGPADQVQASSQLRLGVWRAKLSEPAAIPASTVKAPVPALTDRAIGPGHDVACKRGCISHSTHCIWRNMASAAWDDSVAQTWSRYVSLELRKGTWGEWVVRAWMQSPSALRLLLINCASLRRCPSASVLPIRSLPARSTSHSRDCHSSPAT